jgi:hypothetical protein
LEFREVASRTIGFSASVFGPQWNPPRLDREVDERVIVFLEDRRVLCETMGEEMPE